MELTNYQTKYARNTFLCTSLFRAQALWIITVAVLSRYKVSVARVTR